MLDVRGYVVAPVRATIDATGRQFTPGDSAAHQPFKTARVQVFNEGAADAKLYFTKADFDGDTNFRTVKANDALPFDGPVETTIVWLKSAAGTTVLILFYQSRG